MDRAIDSADVERFRRVVTRRLGLAFADADLALLEQVLKRRLANAGRALDPYLDALDAAREDGAEIGSLSQELTVPETYFFRNMDQFHVLRSIVLPDRLAARAGAGPVRVLSAGCASGEEALSIAMVAEDIPCARDGLAIRAVDVSPAILRKARTGRFSAWAFRETPAEMRARWFRREGGEFVVADALIRRIGFEWGNLVEDDPELWRPESQDIVFCRNVLMYFPSDVARAVVARIATCLAPGGYLFLGHAETLRGLSHDFHLRHVHGAFYYQRRETLAAESPADAPRPRSGTASTGPVAAGGQDWFVQIDRSAARIADLARRAAPATEVAVATPVDFGPALELLARERYDEAIDLLDRASAKAQDDPDALLLYATLLAHGGRLARAEATCRRLLQIDEMSAGARHVLALCREGAGDEDGALEQDRLAGYLDSTFAMPRLRLGQRARRRGDITTARRELTDALRLLVDEDPARLLLFGGGFRREALLALCRAELQACGVAP